MSIVRAAPGENQLSRGGAPERGKNPDFPGKKSGFFQKKDCNSLFLWYNTAVLKVVVWLERRWRLSFPL